MLPKTLAIAAGTAALAFLLLGPVAAPANQTKDCSMTAIDRSICVYEAIMADIRDSYPMEAPGGITSLRQASTTSYVATLSREGFKDIWTYEMTFGDDGSVSIANRTETTE